MTKPTVQLVGEDGNIFNLIAICRKRLRQEGYSQEEINTFTEEVQSSDSYDQALLVITKWFEVE